MNVCFHLDFVNVILSSSVIIDSVHKRTFWEIIGAIITDPAAVRAQQHSFCCTGFNIIIVVAIFQPERDIFSCWTNSGTNQCYFLFFVAVV